MAGQTQMRVILSAAALSLASGIVVLAVAAMRPVTFGWFTTAPQSGQTFTPTDVHFISTQTWIGAILVVLGLLLMTLWIGVRVGSSTRQRNH